MNWEDVRYFLQLVRDGSLSEASRSLRVEHTTIARRVSHFEASLGVRLFDRLPRGWRLTEEGRALVPSAEAVEQASLAFERRATGASSGVVRVTAAPVITSHFLVPRLGAFVNSHPEVTLELSSSRATSNLMRGDADVALRVGARDVPPGLVVRDLCRVGYGFYASPKWAKRRVAERVFIGFDETMRDTAQKDWLDTHAHGSRVALRSPDLLAHLVAANAGLGIALLPHFLVTADTLQPIEVEGPRLERPLSLIFHPEARRLSPVSEVLRFLTELTKTHARLLAGPS